MRALFGLLFVSACSQWFGLSNAPSDDPDGDRIPSESDNCPTVYNPDQSDVDGNGVGDACDTCGFAGGSDDDDDGDGIPNECDACDNRLPDNNGDGIPDACETLPGCTDCAPCLLGPAHDEDGDKIADACDPCAIDPRPTQDLDADGVGDTCDASTNKPSHQLFDSFAEPNQAWFEVGPNAWKIVTDNVRINSTGAADFRFLGTGLGHFVIRTAVSGSAGPSNSQTAGVVAIRGEPVAPDERFNCTITFPKSPTLPTFSLVHAVGLIVSPASDVQLIDSNHYQITLDVDTTSGSAVCTVVAIINNTSKAQTLTNVTSAMPFQTGIGVSGGGVALFEYYQMASDN